MAGAREFLVRFTGKKDGSVDRAAAGTQKALGGAAQKSTALWAGVGAAIGTTIAAGLAKAASAAADYIGGSIEKASDLNETVSKSQAIFQGQYASMDKWAQGAVKNLGMSRAAALDAASGFGDMFSQIGFGQTEAAGMSKSVVQMATDFGSFNNLDTADVMDRISGAFRGEYDALQKVIPNISAARVAQEAMAASGKKNASELTAQEKATAVLAIMQKDGSRAMGDFAKTSDGAANKAKILAASSEELQAKIGEKLLPAYTKIQDVLLNQVIPAGERAVDMLSDFAGWVEQNQTPILATAAAIGVLAAGWTALSVAQGI
ncbi:MAG: hypothetical protein ACK5Q5_22680, partial [Planctomycetaceae bacterium]